MGDSSLPSMEYRFVSSQDETGFRNVFTDNTSVITLSSDVTTTAVPGSSNPSTNNMDFSTMSLLLGSLSELASTMSFPNSSGNDSDLISTLSTVWEPCDRENPMFNCTVLEFLEYYQGPQMMPFVKAIMVSHLSCLLSLQLDSGRKQQRTMLRML